MAPRQAPEINLNEFDCPHCQTFSHQIRGDLTIKVHTYWDGQKHAMQTSFTDSAGVFQVAGSEIHLEPPSGAAPPIDWTYSLCVACKRPSVWRGEFLFFPSKSTVGMPHSDMPEQAKELYLEARDVLPVSRRAAAALARASLEALLRELDADSAGKRLDQLIGELHSRIGTSLWQLITALRVVGNDSLHSEAGELVALFLDPTNDVAVEPLFGAINEIVEQVITRPSKAAELYAMIPEGKRAAAEKKASAATVDPNV